jgi:hypothetical protein
LTSGITVCVSAITMLSLRFQESGPSLPARAAWIAFWLSFFVGSMHQGC